MLVFGVLAILTFWFLGISLGVLTFAVTAVLVFVGAVQSVNGCWPVKQHTGCY